MSSPTINSTTLQAHHLKNLVAILRQANQRYKLVADSIRRSFNPTNHARNHAARLGLSVNIKNAAACPQRQISQIPLPLLDTGASPTHATVERPVQVAPVVAKSYVRQALAHEPLHVTIPNVSRCYRHAEQATVATPSAPSPVIPQAKIVGATSRFSVTPNNPLFKLGSEKETRVDVPMNTDEMRWEEVDLAEILTSSEACTSSSSSSSSSGPDTPVDDAPIMIRIKRKSVIDCEEKKVEKRPKYERNVRIPCGTQQA